MLIIEYYSFKCILLHFFRAFDHIFETVSVEEGKTFLVNASYLEIYNEEIRDLLGKDTKQKLDLKEHPDKGVYVMGKSTTHSFKNIVLTLSMLRLLLPIEKKCKKF